jgi:hypothetical protein
MNNVQSMIESVASSEKVEKARQRFRFKPYHVRYSALLTSAKIARVVLPALSIATGCLFLAETLGTALPVWLAVALSVACVSLLEVVKGNILTLSFEGIVTSSKAGFGLLVVSVLIAGGSVFLSVSGVKVLHQRLDTSTSDLQTVHGLNSDSLKAHYSEQIQAVDRRIQAIEQHKGKRWGGLLSASENKQILAYQSQIEALRTEQAEQLTALQAEQFTERNRTTEQARFNGAMFVALAVSVELLILLCGWFVVYFDFMTLKESERLQVAQKFSLSIDDLQTMLSSYSVGQSVTAMQTIEAKNQIGFKAGATGAKMPVESDKNSDLLSGATGAIAAIKAGVTDRRFLMKTYRLNVQKCNALIAEHGS